MKTLASVLLMVLVIVSAGTVQANDANDQLLRMSDKERNSSWTRFMQGSGERCVVKENFLQGVSKEGKAFWNVRCTNGDTWSIMIENDAEGSTKIIKCSVLELVAKTKCFTKF